MIKANENERIEQVYVILILFHLHSSDSISLSELKSEYLIGNVCTRF